MSISVKNISVAIAGTTSTAFDIELEGTRYHMDDFTLSQSLLTHNMLSFSMHKALPDEEINEPQFELCGYIIGKKITVSLKTVSIESESLNGGGDTIADIEFKGFITSASATRENSCYRIQVEALSWDALLDDAAACKSFEQKSL
ncbi:MAG: hypothetical protein IJ879_07295, partial [Muribaculaceae bacterium]|nr:hypothetical protein [Muribaculaceae bacterium]